MKCTINFTDSAFAKVLQEQIGNNDVLFMNNYLTCLNEDGSDFSKEFKEWYSTSNKKDIPNLDTKDKKKLKTLVKSAIDFYYTKHPSVKHTAREQINDKSVLYDYNSNTDRELGKKLIAGALLEYYNTRNSNSDINNNNLSWYVSLCKQLWFNNIVNYINKQYGFDKETIKKEYNEAIDKAGYIKKWTSDNDSVVGRNLYAVYQELYSSNQTAIAYINEIFTNPILQDLYHNIKDELDTINDKNNTEANSDITDDIPEGSIENNDVELDTSVTDYNNHQGLYNSYLKHVSSRIRNYFNSLKKQNSSTIGDFDCNNSFGIAEYMDAVACCNMLYNHNNFKNVKDMINTIEQISKNVKGFESFSQVAEDLKNNTDLANELFSVFAKTKINKTEVVSENDKITTRQSNRVANPNYILFGNFADNVRNNILNNNFNTNVEEISELHRAISSKINTLSRIINNQYLSNKEKEEEITKLKNNFNNNKTRLVKLLKLTFPSIQEAAITSYIELNDNAVNNLHKQITNATNLVSILQNIIKESKNSNNIYNEQLNKLASIREHNNQLNENRNKNIFINFSDYKDESDAFTEDFAESTYKYIHDIVDCILPYSIVNTELTSRNIYGNLNSNIINNSYFTNFDKMMNSFYEETLTDDKGHSYTRTRNKILEAWGNKKLRSNQYKYSNILLEQTDEKGNVINKGLFRYVNGQLCITEDAKDLLKLSMFAGSSNIDNQSNMSYVDMVTTNYQPTVYSCFFNPVSMPGEVGISNNYANYFLRTPADAPQTYMIRGPRYKHPYKVKNREEVKTSATELADNHYNKITSEQYKEKYAPNNSNESSFYKDTDILKLFLAKGDSTFRITNLKSVKPISEINKENGSYEAYVSYYNKETKGFIVMKGTVVKRGDNNYLENASYEAIYDNKFFETNNPLFDYYFNELNKHDIVVGDKTYKKLEYDVDVNSSTFKMIKNQFKQEMLDAADALNHYFVLKKDADGCYTVELKNGKPVLKEGMSETKGYAFYHLGKSGKLLDKQGAVYKLGGSVFGSNKFTLVTNNENGELEPINYLDDVIADNATLEDDGNIRFLYGGAMRIVAEENEDGSLKVTDIVFSDKQNAKIDEALTKYLLELQKQAIEKIEDYKDNTPQNKNIDDISDFIVNNQLMFYAYDELFEGNSKFYKDPQTMFKRAKEGQGSGIPFGIADYSSEHEDLLQEIGEESWLNNGVILEDEKETYVDEKGNTKVRQKLDENGFKSKTKTPIQDFFKGTLFEGVKQRYGFRAVTIKNIVRTNNEALEELVNKLVKESNITEDQARDILFGPVQIKNGKVVTDKNGKPVRRGGFTETKVNDAQSYITVQEWVRRVAAKGKFQQYLPLIKKLIEADKNPDIKLSAEDLQEFVQVQKNFYYDQYYDERYGIYVPRQIKNAEFVLIPSMIKGTQLEHIYNIMKEGNIDQLNTVETSKAANETVLTVWNNDGDIEGLSNLTDETAINKRITELANELNSEAQIYSYNNLYTQQETPQHIGNENKVGIQFIKKIVDNLPNDDSPLGKLKKALYEMYTSNITESFTNLMDEWQIPYDENNNIKINKDGYIEGLNTKVFYDKLKEQLMRSGLDTNLADYVTLSDDFNIPKMPSYMNNVLTRFESVVQSIFNNNITRQTLPGFHAVQVTNIGFQSLSDGITEHKYSKDFRYHPEGKGYIEVGLPLSFLHINRNDEHYKNMTNEEILAELEKKGLDKIVGYRIPTEGKQSMCNMKVTRILDDSYGSTIIVPDDWVSQTGSDFDVDSVYALNYETYKTNTGEVKKIEYKTADERNKYDWFNYVRRFTDKSLNKDIKGTILEAKKELQALQQEEFENLQKEESEAYNIFNDKTKELIKKKHLRIKKQIKEKGLTGRAAYIYQLSETINWLKTRKNKSESFLEKVNSYEAVINNLINYLNNQTEDYNNKSKDLIDKLLKERLNEYETAAKKAGLLSLDEYLKKENDTKANSRKARNSKILDICWDILSDPATLEENLSRSNFDDITAALLELMNPNIKTARDGRTCYNIFDQIAYQNDAIACRKLKGISVVGDTFCSVCNQVKPILSKPVYVVYDSTYYDDLKTINKRYSNQGYKQNKKSFSIRHNTYGWTNDNRNIANKILTSYSSQTTAYILDSIKEGSIPGVNIYTFPVFKFLANMGLDYRTSIGFMMQPGIAEIIKANDNNNSLFTKSNFKNNPIHEAIKNIAKQLDITIATTDDIDTICKKLNDTYGKKFNKIFKQEGDKNITITVSRDTSKNLPIIQSKCIARLKETDEFSSTSPVEERLLFDLGVILTFNNLHNITNEIDDIMRCTNPDKFGAKQTVFETRQIFENIFRQINKTEKKIDIDEKGNEIISNVKKQPILEVEGKHILEAIYPGINDDTSSIEAIIENLATHNNVKDSKYPSLYCFLKYASCSSCIIGRSVFETQDIEFVKLIEGIKSVFSNNYYRLDEKTYDDFQKYTLNYMYNQVPTIKYKVQVRTDNKGNIKFSQEEYDINERKQKADEETSRIYGYSHNPSLVINSTETITNDEGKTITRQISKLFTVKNLNSPTNEEMELFEQLSPAQKVEFIKQNFEDAGIFKYLQPLLYNGKNRGFRQGMQTIEYTDEGINPNIIFNEFKQAFYNNNPLIVSTAIDVVKYAVQVEGMRITAHAINKVIDNDCLINSFGQNGLGFIDSMRNMFADIKSNKGLFGININDYGNSNSEVDKLYENYLRSHPNLVNIKSVYLSKQNVKRFGLYKQPYGLYSLKPFSKNGELTKDDIANFNHKMTVLGVKVYDDVNKVYRTNKYIRFKDFKNNNLLYKITEVGNEIFLYPLGNLMQNENNDRSINANNNKGLLSKEAYEALIADFINQHDVADFNYKYIIDKVNYYKETGEIKDLFYKNKNVSNNRVSARKFDINELAEKDNSTMGILKEQILKGDRYIKNRELQDYIFSPGIEFGSIQNIKFASNNTQKVILFIPENIKEIENYYLRYGENVDNTINDAVEEIEDNSIKNIIKNARAAKLKHLTGVVKVEPLVNVEKINNDDEAYASSFEDFVSESIDFANARRSFDNEQNAINYLEKLKVFGVNTDVNSILATEQSKKVSARETAKYINKTSDYIKNTLFAKFIEDPDNANMFIPITDDRIINMIKNNPKLMDKYMAVCNYAKGFINTYNKYNELDVSSEDKDIQLYINDIKESINKINKLPLDDLMHKCSQAFVDKYSTNPLIKEGLIDVMDGFWKTYGYAWQFNDLMENGTPILQNIMKEVMGDLDAKQKHFEHKVRKEFWKKVNEIKAAAAANGMVVDFNKFIDEDGRFVQDYVNKFVDDINKLGKAVDDAAKQFGFGSIEHLKAKLEYDEFKAEYCQQEVKPEYYKQLNHIIRKAIYGYDYVRPERPEGISEDDENPVFGSNHVDGIPKLYSAYMKLYYERLELYNYANKQNLNEVQRKRLDDINNIIYILTHRVNPNSEEYYNDAAREAFNNEFSEEDKIELLDTRKRYTLHEIVKDIRELKDRTFEYDEVFGFQQQLKNRLAIIESFEKRDADGIPTVPQEVLDMNQEYVEARDWLSANAKFVVDVVNNDYGIDEGFEKLIKEAFEALNFNSTRATINDIMNKANEGKGIKDSRGILNGILLTKEERARLKEIQSNKFGLSIYPPFTDRILISNAIPATEFYSQDFYEGLSNDKEKHPLYYQTVTELNKLLEPYYNNLDGNIHFEQIPDTPEGIAILKSIAQKYQELRALKKTDNVDEESDVNTFIKDNVDFVTNDVAWNGQLAAIKNGSFSDEFKDAFIDLAYERKADGSFVKRGGKFVPNRFLYSYAKPKESVKAKFLDNTNRKKALDTISRYYRKTATKYYYQAMHEAMAKAQANHDNSYTEWYNANHIYNPYTKKMQPLECWLTSELRYELFENNPDKSIKGHWEAKGEQSEKHIRNGKSYVQIGDETIEYYNEEHDFINPNHNKDKGLKGNYIKGSGNGKYDSNIQLNEYEKQMRDYLQETLIQTARVESARRYFKNNYLPRAMRKQELNAKTGLKELGKMFGIGLSSNNGKKDWYDEIGYEYDKTPLMPMTKLLDNKLTIDLNKKIKELNEQEITQEQFNTEEEYNNAIKERDEKIKAYEEQIKQERNSLLNRDWLNVIDCYLAQANRYNAIQDNKTKLYYLHNVLKQMKMYSREYGLAGNLKLNKRKDKEGKTYIKDTDNNLILQYENVLRRLLFDQWKEREGSLTNIANMLQGFTSANYMMLNVRGGIANVTLGETGILGEAAAGEYFGVKDWRFGTAEWIKGSIGFARGGYASLFGHEGMAYNKQDAIIKFFNVVDYDDVTGVSRELDLEKAAKKIRDAMFSPQTIGEHFMQNSVLFAMLHNHKLVTMDDGTTTYMSKQQYVDYRQSQILDEILTDEQQKEYNKFKEKIKEDKNKLKDYAWFRRDLLTDWVYLHTSKEQSKKFFAERDKHKEEFEKKFDEKINMFDQIELGSDGKIAFKEGSELAELDKIPSKQAEDVSEAMQLLGRFSEKVRKVNNKIHGAYNRQGAAYIERKWFGSLVMQYHKHLPIGILKRYMARGYYNETRGSVEKGMIHSIIDVAKLNWDKVKIEAGMTEEETDAIKGFTFMITHAWDYLTQLKETLHIIPQHERANMLRNLGDLVGVVLAMGMCALLWKLGDDDDDLEDALWYNLTLYEMDRLASEAFLYNPIGLANETKKLMSTPIAAQSIIDDALSTLKNVCDWMFDDEYDPYYHSGRFAGEHKLKVYIQRRIPMWNGIQNILNITDNNHYYKLGENPIGIFNIKEKVTD